MGGVLMRQIQDASRPSNIKSGRVSAGTGERPRVSKGIENRTDETGSSLERRGECVMQVECVAQPCQRSLLLSAVAAPIDDVPLMGKSPTTFLFLHPERVSF
jgi:hypothetical protein